VFSYSPLSRKQVDGWQIRHAHIFLRCSNRRGPGTALPRAVPELKAGVYKMGIDRELEREGYEYSDSEAPAEIWISKKAGFGVRLEWFRLER